MSPWPVMHVRELCSDIIDCVNKTAPTVDGPTAYRMLRTTNVKRGRIDLSRVKYVERDTYERWVRRGAPQPGDIILTREAPLGEVGMLYDCAGVFLGQRLVMYRADQERADRHYLLAAMRSEAVQAQIKAFGSGATVEHMRVPDCGELLIPCPPLPAQHRIGALLAGFDELIAINERRIELLEDLTRSLHREWFEQLRFPGHSTVSEPPPDWHEARIGDLAEVISDGVDPSNVAIEMPYCGLEHLPRRATTLRDFGEARSVVSRKLRFRRGDTLFGKIRPYFHKVVWSPFDGIASSDAIVFRARREAPLPALLTTILASDAVVAEAVATSNGTKMPRADPKAILNYRLALPPLDSDLLWRAEGMMRDSYDLAAQLASQNHALARTRDLLLPRLVTGQLDVSDVDLGALTPAEAA